MNKDSDILLVSRCLLLDDRKAFTALVTRHQQNIRRFFLHQTLGNQPLSDDLAQETFIRVYRKLYLFKGVSGFSTWLFRVAYNVFYDFSRQEQRHKTYGLEEAAGVMAVGEDQDKKMDVYRSLCILKEEERTAVILFYMEDLGIDKIAKVMNCPQGTVKSHLLRAKAKLRDYLNHSGYGNND